jgi:hypothetical protein
MRPGPSVIRVTGQRDALGTSAPPDCMPQRWVAAQAGCQRFVGRFFEYKMIVHINVR